MTSRRIHEFVQSLLHTLVLLKKKETFTHTRLLSSSIVFYQLLACGAGCADGGGLCSEERPRFSITHCMAVEILLRSQIIWRWWRREGWQFLSIGGSPN
jgi:hypothetical protein